MKKSLDPFWLVGGLAVLVWVFCFRVFLFRESPIISDAWSFYDHLKFYIDNISRGVYPLWDPLWSCGSPNDFFLRRIGPFNPFLFLILIPYKLGLDYWTAFACFITFYFFLGMTGFYRLTREILKDKWSAIIAFVLLSFSSLSTRVFDSYLMMVMTPMIWFLYFAFVFGRSGRRSAFLGMVFCVMLLMTTYIPFYFIVGILSFAVFFLLIYPKEALNFCSLFLNFVRRSPWLFLLCAAALGFSCAPGFLFFKAAGAGTFSMPLRHFDAADPHVLTVKPEVTTTWAIPEDLFFSSFYLQDLRMFDFAVFYIPLFAWILLCLGVVTKFNRKLLLMFLWGGFLLVMGSPYWFPLYEFLHRHIFFFKYFRNLHFFLWLVILPIAVVFIVEQMRIFLEMLRQGQFRKGAWLVFILAVHAGVAAFLYWQQSFNYSSWVILGFSLILFVWYLFRSLSPAILYGLCLFIIILEPLEVYFHFSRNVQINLTLSVYDQFSNNFQYTRRQKTETMVNGVVLDVTPPPKTLPIYFGTKWFDTLSEGIHFLVLRDYTFSKFIVYDRVEIFDEQKQSLKTVEQTWAQHLNVAFVPVGTPGTAEPPHEALSPAGNNVNPQALLITGADERLRVIANNVNMVKLKVHMPKEIFLVYNDCYYSGWRAYIDGREVPLIRANIAFKGLWVPRGQHEVEFRYERPGQYFLESLMVFFYLAFFLFAIWLWRKDAKGEEVSDVG